MLPPGCLFQPLKACTYALQLCASHMAAGQLLHASIHLNDLHLVLILPDECDL